MSTYIRKRKDGNGYSECSSPDEMVGKGRCCHILEGGNESTMELSKIQRGMYEIKVNDSKLNIEGQKETIIDFFNNLPKIDDEKRDKILNYLSDDEDEAVEISDTDLIDEDKIFEVNDNVTVLNSNDENVEKAICHHMNKEDIENIDED